jgi:UDP-4-amino-4,6-dideoxy-N-acetyl-beta-L-altrosamine N-acetyltransferase
MLRPATDDDRHRILMWRNHPDVRAASLTRHEIGTDEHAAWWSLGSDEAARAVFVYERHGVPSGVVTFFDLDRERGTSSWGYYLDNAGLAERGELLPAWIEIQRQAVALAWEELGLRMLEGEVLDGNEAVRHFNRRNGFEEIGSYVKEIDGVQTLIHRVRALAPGHHAPPE